MTKAGRVHGLRSLIATFLVSGFGHRWPRNLRAYQGEVARRATHRCRHCRGSQNCRRIGRIIVAGLTRYSRRKTARQKSGSKQKLHLALALLPVDEGKVNYLRDQLLVVTPTQFPVVRDALIPHKDAVIEPLWNVALDSKRETQRRFQAACALATYAPGDERWKPYQFIGGRPSGDASGC